MFMFNKYSKIKEELEMDFNKRTEIELEIRMNIIKPKDFKPDKEETLTYYKSDQIKCLTFRSKYKGLIETKEIYDKVKINNYTNLVLSIEKTYLKEDLKLQLIETNKRHIRRQTIKNDPLTTITECNNEYMLEIEFDKNNYKKVDEIMNKYKNKFWPMTKPMEISSKELSKKLNFNNQWVISPKADGLNVLIYEKYGKMSYIYNNGDVEGNIENPDNIYEGELMKKDVLIYDCVMHKGTDVRNEIYIRRREYIPKHLKKEAYILENIDGLKEILNKKYKYNTDGFIITHINKRNLIYKSKFKPTVDLRYINGNLYLEHEYESIRRCDKLLKNYSIYEFDKDLKLIKERPDKNKANFKFPYDDNPLYRIAYGIGIPSLRAFHNKVKLELLNKIKNRNVLLDVGSGKGGDMGKWQKLGFKKIYAVDPELDLIPKCKNIIQIRDKVENVNVQYNCVSILFVPWNNEFYKFMDKECVIAVMSNPKNYKCDAFECIVKENGETVLKIKDTKTANYIIEKEKIKIDDKYEIKFELKFGTKDEKELQKMYKYYYIY
nr:mRNA capping enzyme [Saccharomycopsis crataegensis]